MSRGKDSLWLRDFLFLLCFIYLFIYLGRSICAAPGWHGLELRGSNDPSASASRIAGTPGALAREVLAASLLGFICLIVMGSHYVVPVSLTHVGSRDPPASGLSRSWDYRRATMPSSLSCSCWDWWSWRLVFLEAMWTIRSTTLILVSSGPALGSP